MKATEVAVTVREIEQMRTISPKDVALENFNNRIVEVLGESGVYKKSVDLVIPPFLEKGVLKEIIEEYRKAGWTVKHCPAKAVAPREGAEMSLRLTLPST